MAYAGGGRNSAWTKLARLFMALLLLTAFVIPLKTQAQPTELDVNVSVGVGDTVLRVTGKVAPGALVTIIQDGSVIGTTTATGSGTFDQSFPSQTAGLHNIKLFATTTDGKTTDTVAQNINLQMHAETTLNIFLPSTLELSPAQVKQGEPIIFSGATSPDSTITLIIDNNLSYAADVDSDGRWSITVQTDDFFVGTHHAYAVAQDQSGNQSFPTSKRPFEVTAADDQPVPPTLEPGQPIEPPLITKPQPNQHFSHTPIDICGIALPNSQVEIWEDGEMIGSVFANHRGQWCFRMDLFKPRHEITARVCVEQTCSDFSKPLVIFFDGPEAADFLLTITKYRYTAYVDDLITLDISLEGGEPPFELVVDWGTDTVETITPDKRQLQARYAYETAGHYTGIVTAKDNDGKVRTRYFSVLVKEKPPGALTFATILIVAVIIIAAGLLLFLLRKKKFWQRFTGHKSSQE